MTDPFSACYAAEVAAWARTLPARHRQLLMLRAAGLSLTECGMRLRMARRKVRRMLADIRVMAEGVV